MMVGLLLLKPYQNVPDRRTDKGIYLITALSRRTIKQHIRTTVINVILRTCRIVGLSALLFLCIVWQPCDIILYRRTRRLDLPLNAFSDGIAYDYQLQGVLTTGSLLVKWNCCLKAGSGGRWRWHEATDILVGQLQVVSNAVWTCC